MTYVIEEIITEDKIQLAKELSRGKTAYHEKSQVLSHFALLHLVFVHGLPYASGLK